jgi:anti-sigma-K factor RskA
LALFALYIRRLTQAWRWIYAITAIAALYLNVFVSIAQAFQKIPFIRALAPTQSEPSFLIAQGLALGIVTVLGIFAVMRFRPEMRVAAA